MENPLRMNQQNKILCISFALFLILYFFINKKAAQAEKKSTDSEIKSADTFIPAGFVLVPIQIENSQNLAGFMDAFALVDLYASSENSVNTLIAEKIKMIRAPLNQNQFAVLATESQSRLIMQIKTPFWVVLQNRNSVKADLEKNLLLDEERPNANETKEIRKKEPKVARNKIQVTPPAKITIEYYDKKRL